MKNEMTFKNGDKIRIINKTNCYYGFNYGFLCVVRPRVNSSIMVFMVTKSSLDSEYLPEPWTNPFNDPIEVVDINNITKDELRKILNPPPVNDTRKYYVLRNKRYVEIKF